MRPARADESRAKPAPTFSELRRQMIHMAMGLFALLLVVLTWWQAAAMAALALLFNLFVLPRIGGRTLYRPVDTARGYPTGIVFYPLAVLLLILVFPRRPDIVAAAWAVMAVGDSLATIVGRRLPGPRIPWNRDKSLGGTAAFVAAGAAAAIGLAWWTAPAVEPTPPWTFVVFAPLAAAAVAGLVETLPVRLDDNISVPAVSAAVLWVASLLTAEAWAAGAPDLARGLIPALALNVSMAALGRWAGTVTTGGAVTGAAIGTAIFASAGLAGWLVLFAAFAAAAVTSRMGLERKALLGIAEDRGGRRGPGNALANCLVGAVAAFVAVASPYRDQALLMFVTALAAGSSDTVASEIGKAWGRRTYLVPRLRPVRPGTPGAISLEGTAAGIVAALALGAIGAVLGLVGPGAVWVVAAGATIGAFVESWLGATAEPRGILDNHLLNFVNTAVAAAAALVIARM